MIKEANKPREYGYVLPSNKPGKRLIIKGFYLFPLDVTDIAMDIWNGTTRPEDYPEGMVIEEDIPEFNIGDLYARAAIIEGFKLNYRYEHIKDTQKPEYLHRIRYLMKRLHMPMPFTVLGEGLIKEHDAEDYY